LYCTRASGSRWAWPLPAPRSWLSCPRSEQEELLHDWAGHAGAFAAGHPEELVRANLAETRQKGYSVNPGLVLEGSWGMGAAVFDQSGRPAWALSLTGIEPRFKAERQEELGNLLMAEAHRITQQLGGDGKGSRAR
jgi:DNA-binding IclR family transcriptional regulator